MHGYVPIFANSGRLVSANCFRICIDICSRCFFARARSEDKIYLLSYYSVTPSIFTSILSVSLTPYSGHIDLKPVCFGMLSGVNYSNLLSRTSEDVTKTLELQLYTSRKVLDLTAEIGTLSTLATEALKSSTQIAQILQLISSFHNTSGALKSLSDNVDILASRSQGQYPTAIATYDKILLKFGKSRPRGANSRLAFA